jgi:hypothetical protein
MKEGGKLDEIDHLVPYIGLPSSSTMLRCQYLFACKLH